VAVNKNKITAQAQKLTAKGQFEKAIQEYKKLVKAEPNDIRTWLKMGDLYTRMGARKEATETYLKVAEHYRRSDFHLKAVAVYKQVLKLDPTLIDVYELLGDAYMSLGLNSDALIQFEQLADMYQRSGRLDRMLQVLVRMAEMDPQNISTRLRIAEQFSKEEQIEAACEHFKIACAQLREQGRTDDYLKVAERLLYHDQSLVDVARETAAAYLEKGQTKRALAKLQLCFSKDPHNVQTLELLAHAFQDLRQPDKAVSVYLEIANLLKGTGQTAEHERILGLVLGLDPKNEIARKALGGDAPAPTEPAGEDDGLPSPAFAASGAAGRTEARESATQLGDLSDETAASRAEKMLGEAEVLFKYGLVERAKEHIAKIFEFDYFNLDARERYKDILLEEGNRAGAVEQLFVLAEGFIQEQPEGSVYFLHQVLAIDPYSRRARDMITAIGGVMPEGLPELDRGGGLAPDGLLDGDLFEEPAAGLAEPRPSPETVLEIDDDQSAFQIEPSIDDVPYAPGENELTELDLEGDDWGEEEILELPSDDAIGVAPDLDSGLYELVGGDEPASAPAPAPAPERTSALPKPPVRSERPRSSVVPPPVKEEPPAPAGEGALPDLSEEIEEVEFFLSQGLQDEARGIVEMLLEQHPGHPEVLALRDRVTPGPAPVAEGAFDLDALAEDLGLEDVVQDDASNEIDEVFSQFKAGVEKQVSQTDFATHYDLGVAYREMGLFDDAISEFEISLKDPHRAPSSQMMIGMCHAGAGRLQDAIIAFEEGLEIEGLGEDQKLALMYELGKAFEMHDRAEDALEVYNDILKQDPGFADVVDRIELLEEGGGEGAGGRSVFS